MYENRQDATPERHGSGAENVFKNKTTHWIQEQAGTHPLAWHQPATGTVPRVHMA